MPELYSDDNGNRVIIRHRGPAGKGIPAGGAAGQILAKSTSGDFATQWVAAPGGTDGVTTVGLPLDGKIATFLGTTGRVIEDSGVSLAQLATVANLALKQDASATAGLSEVNFTPALKTKLDGLSNKFRGTYYNEASLATISLPQAGDYCVVEVTVALSKLFVWNGVNSRWDVIGSFTGTALAALLFKAGDVWTQETSRIFTTAEKDLIVAHEALITSLGLTGVGSGKAYGSLSYYNKDSPLTIPTSQATTDGINDMVPISAANLVLGAVANFDSSAPGNLRHTANTTKMFNVAASISAYNAVGGVQFVFALAKNGNVIPQTRQLVTGGTSASNVSLTGNISLELNAHVSVFVGTYVAGYSPTIQSISLTVAEA